MEGLDQIAGSVSKWTESESSVFNAKRGASWVDSGSLSLRKEKPAKKKFNRSLTKPHRQSCLLRLPNLRDAQSALLD